MIRAVLLLALGLLGACARSPVVPIESAQLPQRVELTEVPFFAQQDYQCGPAALATMLVHQGVETSPEQLVDQVYIPGRKGSLQVEMVAAARSRDLLVYPLAQRMEALLAEVAAGNPVLVLQNLAFDHWPQWHFAVVVGYDLEGQTITLRSGTTRRWTGSFHQFARTWAKGDRWAVVTVQPDQLPATAEEGVWLKAANDLEQTGRTEAASRAYMTAAEHWSSHLAWFALGNLQYTQGDRQGAEQALRNSVGRDNGFAAGWFNLSQVLAERGCAVEASSARRCAAKLMPADSRFSLALPVALQTGESSCQQVLPQCPDG